ncbi:hypothetical protein BEWA_036570 [Theileria equi strain WA]|uniref:Uncharacterized protein n=1 Tax=Theileria equi strain WA TaxID=1537102 RepID=L1LE50_THEEQ|nr:hypothetical protein BEWA_036570 [Theileria equi strain WA]EKX73621.1 hypothetical protein BEWA_036570 [Theileria equi strain WA]|eukprot:XP_004833073.1 hypothetical protein BEWA_036570 [Theileria equi strain WA]
MTGKGVTIDIGNTPVKHGVQKEHDNKYYYDDEHRERAEMTLVEHPSEAPGYKKLEHKPKGNNAKILRIDNVGGTRTEFNNDLDDCKIVIVYYWSGDGDYTDPLVVQLSGEQDKYYTDTGSKWTNADIKSDDLLKTLDEQNCLRMAHIIDISQNPSSSTTTYYCPACHKQEAISISSLDKDNYKRVSHSPDESKSFGEKYRLLDISYFRDIFSKIHHLRLFNYDE